jgi:hypothetical protein
MSCHGQVPVHDPRTEFLRVKASWFRVAQGIRRSFGVHDLGCLSALAGGGFAGLWFFETVTLTGTRMFVLAVIEHHSRRIRVLGATAHPCAFRVTQTARNLVMDLLDAGCWARFLIRDRDGKFPEFVRRRSGRCGGQGRAHRCPDAENERVHGAVGPDLPTRAPRPDLDLEPAPSAARSA